MDVVEKLCSDAASSQEGYQCICYVRTVNEAAQTILALRKEVDGLTTYARDISKAITGLSAGAGSEWFKPVGDDHFVDPAFAAERLSTMLADGRDAKRQLIRERRAAHQGAGEP